ncbi:MAG TPA: hypothetical protein VF551_03200 [Chthoniobacterales bacterium]
MTPPPRRAAGCFGIGCLSFAGFFLFLGVAFVGGGIWAVHHLRQNYSSTAPLSLAQLNAAPEDESARDDAPFNEQETAVPTPPALESAPVPPPPRPPRANRSGEAVERRWKAFERAARRGERARIELTDDEINALLTNDPDLRGKALVDIRGNVGHVRVSIPLDKLVFMGGRYLNGEATVESSPDGDPAKARISNILIGNQPMADDFLDRRIFGSSLRSYITDWVNEQNLSSFRIEGGRVIGETR